VTGDDLTCTELILLLLERSENHGEREKGGK